MSPRATSSIVERLVGVARRDLSVEQHLPEQVAELFAELFAGSLFYRVDELGALLHEVGHQRAVIDLLRPHASVADGPHRLGRFAKRIQLLATLTGIGHGTSVTAVMRRWCAARSDTRIAATMTEITDPASTPRIA